MDESSNIHYRTRNRSATVLIPLSAADLDLPSVLLGGQAFRWRFDPESDSFVGVACGNVWRVGFTGDGLRIDCLSPESLTETATAFARRYFDLDFDYGAAVGRLRDDPRLAVLFDSLSGIRLLRQEPFETVIGFIVSANNHIGRISRIVELLSRRFGSPVPSSDGEHHAFPTPEQLAGAAPEDLRRHCTTGYRDRYIVETAQRFADRLDEWRNADSWPDDDLRRRLTELPGVGPKVAECVLLFGYGRRRAFPIDTWIRKGIVKLWFPDRPPTRREVAEFVSRRLGDHAGLVQQYLFEAMRRGLIR